MYFAMNEASTRTLPSVFRLKPQVLPLALSPTCSYLYFVFENSSVTKACYVKVACSCGVSFVLGFIVSFWSEIIIDYIILPAAIVGLGFILYGQFKYNKGIF